MKKPILVKRYTQGLVGSLADEAEFTAVSRELAEFSGKILAHAGLKDLLASPFVAVRKKVQVIKSILAVSGFTEKTRRFLLLLLENDRLGLLEDILETLPVVWYESRGVTTFDVSSVVALGGIQKKELQDRLERLEGRPVFLRFSIDPGLVAGLSMRKGNLVYDASVKGQLTKIKERISEG